MIIKTGASAMKRLLGGEILLDLSTINNWKQEQLNKGIGKPYCPNS